MERHSLSPEAPLWVPPDDSFLDYLAGFIDADGCVRIATTTPYVSLTNRYLPFLIDVSKAFGGSIRESEGVWRYEATGANARRILRHVGERLWEKKEQARLCLIFGDFPPHSAMRTAILKRLSELKKTPYPATVTREESQ